MSGTILGHITSPLGRQLYPIRRRLVPDPPTTGRKNKLRAYPCDVDMSWPQARPEKGQIW